MEAVIAIITLVCSVLNIILFFKIWGMTDNIKRIKDVFIASSIKQDDIKVGDIVIHREFNDAMIVLEVDGDANKIKCKSLTSNDEFNLNKDRVFVINQK